MNWSIERWASALLMPALAASLLAAPLLLASSVLTGCDKDEGSAIGEGETVSFAMEGLRGIIERQATASTDRLLVAGRSGRDLHGRVLWGDTGGNVLLDAERHGIQQPERVVGCIEGDAADIYWLTYESYTEADSGSAIFIESIRDNAIVDTGVSGGPDLSSAQRLSMGRIVGLDEGCGVCVFDPVPERLSCQMGFVDGGEQRSWHTGPLGEWSVLANGEGLDDLIVADWGADEEGLIVIRITPLEEDAEPIEHGWLHSFQIGQLPSIVDPAERHLAHPTFLPAGDHVDVIFVDGTDWFTRLFVQRFPLDEVLPETPTLVESCRGTCKIHWADLYDDTGWMWFEDQNGHWAVRVNDDEELARVGFNPPPNVESLDHGLFKMGLGNEVANWWALIEFEIE